MNRGSWIAPPCPLCDAVDRSPALSAQEGGDPAGRPFSIARCQGCGHLYTCPRPGDEDLGSLYPGAYHQELARPSPAIKEKDKTLRALRDHFAYPPRPGGPFARLRSWPEARRLRRRPYLDALPWVGQGRLLDYGCGACAFLQRQRARGWSVAGLEISEDAADAGRALGLEVQTGAWPGPAFSERSFDVITAWHVLEHAPNPRAWVRHAAAALAPGGLLVICCPVRDSWARELFGEDWVGWELPRHLSHFSRAELRQLVDESGLTLTDQTEQARSATLRAGAARRGRRLGSALWRWLARRRAAWSLLAALSRPLCRADGAIVVARKPA